MELFDLAYSTRQRADCHVYSIHTKPIIRSNNIITSIIGGSSVWMQWVPPAAAALIQKWHTVTDMPPFNKAIRAEWVYWTTNEHWVCLCVMVNGFNGKTNYRPVKKDAIPLWHALCISANNFCLLLTEKNTKKAYMLPSRLHSTISSSCFHTFISHNPMAVSVLQRSAYKCYHH